MNNYRITALASSCLLPLPVKPLAAPKSTWKVLCGHPGEGEVLFPLHLGGWGLEPPRRARTPVGASVLTCRSLAFGYWPFLMTVSPTHSDIQGRTLVGGVFPQRKLVHLLTNIFSAQNKKKTKNTYIFSLLFLIFSNAARRYVGPFYVNAREYPKGKMRIQYF